MLKQQPTLWSDVFQAKRGWGDFDDNDYVKDGEVEPRQGQGKQFGGWLISNMMKRMTTRTRRGLGPGNCDGSVGLTSYVNNTDNIYGGGLQLVIRTCTAQWLNVDEPRLSVII